MNLFDVFILGIALGIDCLVVSFSQGLCICNKCKKISLRTASVMGLLQGLMPVLSYYMTNFIYDFLQPISKFVVFGIFMFLGLKFIIETLKDEKTQTQFKCGWRWFFLLGFLTSIDAFGTGISLKLTSTPLLSSVFIIGLTSFGMSVLGFSCSSCFAIVKTGYMNITGGLILIFLAIKNLL